VIELSEKLKNLKWKVDALSMTGFTYMQEGKFNTSIEYYLQALKIYEKLGNEFSCLIVLGNLCEINRLLGNVEMHLHYLKQAEKIGSRLPQGEFHFNYTVPQVYNEYAYHYLFMGDYEQALSHAMHADSIGPEFHTLNKCETKLLLAKIHLLRDENDSALSYAKTAYYHADILKDVTLYMKAGKILSDILIAQQNYPEAEAEAFKAWQIDSTNLDKSRGIAGNLALANIYMGNTGQAAYYHKKYNELNAQYSEKSFQTIVSDLAISYETEKKEAQIKSLEYERRLYIWLIVFGGLFLIAMAITLLLTIRNARKQRLLIAGEAIQKGEIGERARIAEDLHDRLGGSLSAVKIGLKNAESLQLIGDKLDACMKEVREITNNIMPRSLRLFGLKGALEDLSAQALHVQFHFFGEEKRLQHSLEYAVYCCARELVSNAQKHAGAKHINVQLVQNRKYLTLIVQDDGCGFDEKTVVKGDGLQNIRNRVASCRGKLDISSSPEIGTETVIEMKVENI
jgi:signal transduction histidine kinase